MTDLKKLQINIPRMIDTNRRILILNKTYVFKRMEMNCRKGYRVVFSFVIFCIKNDRIRNLLQQL